MTFEILAAHALFFCRTHRRCESAVYPGQLQPPHAIKHDEDFFVETLHSTLEEGNYTLLSDSYYKVATSTGAPRPAQLVGRQRNSQTVVAAR